MRRLCAVLVALAAVAAAGKLNPVTTLPDETPVPYSEDVERPETTTLPGTDGFIVGTVDTVGGSTYDWLANGPVYRMLCNSDCFGVHVLWMFSASNQTTHPDRNMRYNFYDYGNESWNWIDPDFMQSGVNVFTDRCGYGNLSVEWGADIATATCHFGSGALTPRLARDLATGAGIFEYCPGPANWLWPPHAVGLNDWYHVSLMDDPGRQSIWYARCSTWCDWETPVQVATPTFPTQNICASVVSEKVAIAWVVDATSGADPGYYQVSTDGGTSWGSPTQLPYPDAYGGDTLTSFHIASMFPYYDRTDRLHIAACVMPYVDGTGYVIPADIWHWCPDNTPNWTRIRRAECNPLNLAAAVGYNAIYACRPSMGEDLHGGLFVTWEEFDSSNVEPGPPERLRADIFYAQDNGDNGQSWMPAVKITDRNTTTKRFPSSIGYIADRDSFYVTYIIDQQAGFFVQGEGSATNNPVVVHKVPLQTGIKHEEQLPHAARLAVAPNPAVGRAWVDYALPRDCRVKLAVYDLAGRPVALVEEGHRAAGRHHAVWRAQGLSPGVYVAKLTAGDEVLTRKLILTE